MRTTEADYNVKAAKKAGIVGATVSELVASGWQEERTMGVVFLRPDGTRVVGWVLRDPEGNGSGWLEFEEDKNAR